MPYAPRTTCVRHDLIDPEDEDGREEGMPSGTMFCVWEKKAFQLLFCVEAAHACLIWSIDALQAIRRIWNTTNAPERGRGGVEMGCSRERRIHDLEHTSSRGVRNSYMHTSL